MKKTAPAKIEHPNEGDIYRIVLTPDAEKRLQISTQPVQQQTVPRTRTVGGDVVVPDGASLFVTAPVAGTLLKPSDHAAPRAGQQVSSGETVYLLRPLLAPDREVPTAAERVGMANAKASLISSQITADGDVKQAEARLEAAQVVLSRAERLLADKVGSARDVDDAKAQVEIADKGLEAARARKELLDRLTLEAKTGQVSNLPIVAPQDGILRSLSSSVGSMVNAATPLFEIVDLRTLWIRVPIYPGQRDQIAAEKGAIVKELGEKSEGVIARPIPAPPTADALSATVDLYYELTNSGGRLHPGERIEVTLSLTEATDSLCVPRAAVLRDIHGVAWVYVNSAEHEYRRHRVEVRFTTEELAVLSHGPAAGTAVVVDGAAELFGTEFGAHK